MTRVVCMPIWINYGTFEEQHCVTMHRKIKIKKVSELTVGLALPAFSLQNLFHFFFSSWIFCFQMLRYIISIDILLCHSSTYQAGFYRVFLNNSVLNFILSKHTSLFSFRPFRCFAASFLVSALRLLQFLVLHD